MPYYITVYDWSLYTTSLTSSELDTSTHGNDPAQTGSNPYNPSLPTWTGVDFTYNGTGSDGTLLAINDDDGMFEDAYVETGSSATLAQDVTIGGQDYFTGEVVENEFSLINSGGLELWVLRINGVNVGFAYPNGMAPSNGEVFNANDTRDGDGLDSLDQVTPSTEPYQNILCFGEGTLIATPQGPLPVETLRPGMQVDTLDNGPQPVCWMSIQRYKWPPGTDLGKPILLREGSLGEGLPCRDLVLSAQHRVLMPYDRQPRGVLAPAIAFTRLPGVRQMNGKRNARLVHVMCTGHQVLLAEGLPCESFYPGDVATAGLPPMQRLQVAALNEAGFKKARPFMRRRMAEEWLHTRRTCWDMPSLTTILERGQMATFCG